MSNKSRGMCNYGSPIKRVLLLNSVGWKRSVQSPRPRLKSGNSRNCCNEIFVTSKGSNFWWLLRASGQAHAHTQTHIDWCFTLTWRLSFLFFDITFKWPPLPPPCPPQADTICVCLSCRDSFYSYSTTQHEPQHIHKAAICVKCALFKEALSGNVAARCHYHVSDSPIALPRQADG